MIGGARIAVIPDTLSFSDTLVVFTDFTHHALITIGSAFFDRQYTRAH